MGYFAFGLLIVVGLWTFWRMFNGQRISYSSMRDQHVEKDADEKNNENEKEKEKNEIE